MKVLVVDVGGNNVKLWHSDFPKKRRFPSGKKLTAAQMVSQTLDTARDWPFEVVALGLPCRVLNGEPVEEPANLGEGWPHFDYAAAIGKPVLIVNDAVLAALGAYRGGRMLFLGLGTGVGSTLIVDDMVLTLDLGRLRHGNRGRIAELLGKQGQETAGIDKWRSYAEKIIPRLKAALLADDLVIGGGEADELDPLPADARRVGNDAVRAGGIRLWTGAPAVENCRREWRFL